jgi:fructokinase
MRIGIDLGGTKIEGIVLGDDGSILARHRELTPRGNYGNIVTAIASIVGRLEASAGRRCPVGIGMPGTLSPYSGLARNSNTVELNGMPLDRDLERVLERPLRFENDANCFALSEAADGAASDAMSVFGVILGTGTGGGLVFAKQIWRGRNAVAGEWGHNPLPWPRAEELPGPPCYCGRRGCLETFLSGSGLAHAYTAAGGEELAADQIAARIPAGEATASAALATYADRLARGLATVINIVDPDVIVLGGGLSNIGVLVEQTGRSLPAYVFSDHLETRLVRARHGDSSGVRGAAWLWPPE